MPEASPVGATENFAAPGATIARVDSVTSTIVVETEPLVAEQALPKPTAVEASVPRERVPSRASKKRRRSSISDLSGGRRKSVVNTPTKRARSVFRKIAKGEEVDQQMKNQLSAALSAFVTRGEEDALEVAIKEGADPNWSTPVTPLYAAVDLGKVDFCVMLLNCGASLVIPNDANDETPLALALKNPDSKIASIFLKHIERMEQAFLRNGVDEDVEVDNQGSTPLRANVSSDVDEEPPRKRAKN